MSESDEGEGHVDRSKLDQNASEMAEVLATQWAALYQRLMRKDVGSEAAAQFVCAYITATVPRFRTDDTGDELE